MCLRGCLSDTLIQLEAFKRICLSSKNRLFSKGFCSKNDQILKSALLTCLCPKGSWHVVELPWESFLCENNALRMNFLFNPNPDFTFCGLETF